MITGSYSNLNVYASQQRFTTQTENLPVSSWIFLITARSKPRTGHCCVEVETWRHAHPASDGILKEGPHTTPRSSSSVDNSPRGVTYFFLKLRGYTRRPTNQITPVFGIIFHQTWETLRHVFRQKFSDLDIGGRETCFTLICICTVHVHFFGKLNSFKKWFLTPVFRLFPLTQNILAQLTS